MAGALAFSGCAPLSRWGVAVPCQSLGSALSAKLPDARVHTAEWVHADGQGHPAHCRVVGERRARTGTDGHRYAIGFELRLPADWNQRFLHQTNGGTDGVLRPALGHLGVLERDALSRGFAVLSSDGGHLADDPARARQGLARGVAFGLDPQARGDFAQGALDAVWPVAQQTITLHYGRAPQRNYLAGCGNGGRLGLVAASRHPERYDGILAGAPALRWPQAALQHAWDWQNWLRVRPGQPQQAFSPADMQLIARQVVARCDALDMVTDGMVSDTRRCQQVFRLADLRCRGAKTAQCLSAAQVEAMAFTFAGPHDRQARPIYTDWPYDPGIASAAWRHWRLSSTTEGWQGQPVAATMGAAALAYLFTTPPQPVPGTVQALADYLMRLDFDQAAQRLATNTNANAHARTAAAAGAAKTAAAAEDPFMLADTQAPALAAFMQRQGKLLIYHGAADPAFSLHATLQWAEQFQSRWGLAKADTTARVFAVPGMGHCQGGPATDRFDALGALVDWVENGRAPDQLRATANPGNAEWPADWPRQRSRLLCPWPRTPRYGGGPVESASSFRCVVP